MYFLEPILEKIDDKFTCGVLNEDGDIETKIKTKQFKLMLEKIYHALMKQPKYRSDAELVLLKDLKKIGDRDSNCSAVLIDYTGNMETKYFGIQFNFTLTKEKESMSAVVFDLGTNDTKEFVLIEHNQSEMSFTKKDVIVNAKIKTHKHKPTKDNVSEFSHALDLYTKVWADNVEDSGGRTISANMKAIFKSMLETILPYDKNLKKVLTDLEYLSKTYNLEVDVNTIDQLDELVETYKVKREDIPKLKSVLEEGYYFDGVHELRDKAKKHGYKGIDIGFMY